LVQHPIHQRRRRAGGNIYRSQETALFGMRIHLRFVFDANIVSNFRVCLLYVQHGRLCRSDWTIYRRSGVCLIGSREGRAAAHTAEVPHTETIRQMHGLLSSLSLTMCFQFRLGGGRTMTLRSLAGEEAELRTTTAL
jgi:hypothetical protein